MNQIIVKRFQKQEACLVMDGNRERFNPEGNKQRGKRKSETQISFERSSKRAASHEMSSSARREDKQIEQLVRQATSDEASSSSERRDSHQMESNSDVAEISSVD